MLSEKTARMGDKAKPLAAYRRRLCCLCTTALNRLRATRMGVTTLHSGPTTPDRVAPDLTLYDMKYELQMRACLFVALVAGGLAGCTLITTQQTAKSASN